MQDRERLAGLAELAESNNHSRGRAGGEYPEFSVISATLVRARSDR
jgi:hypothetical protein